MINFTQVINNLTVTTSIEAKSYDPKYFIVSGSVEKNLTGTSTIDFTVDNNDMEDTYEIKYSISGSGNQFFGAMAHVHAKATTVALEQAEHYYTLAKELEDPKAALKAILRTLTQHDFDKALLFTILSTNTDKKLKEAPNETMVTALIKDKRFNKVIEGLGNGDNNEPVRLKLLELLVHKSDIKHKAAMVRPEGANKATTRTDALIAFVHAIRKDIEPLEITRADIWGTPIDLV